MPTIPMSSSVDAVKTLSAEVRTLKLSGHVGFDSLPNQLVNKAVCHGFDFNILCVGETGVGKSTLIDTLFNHRFDSKPSTHSLDQPNIQALTYDLKEAGVKLKLNIVESNGYGDQVNKEQNAQPIIDYVDEQFESYLQEELKIKRSLSSFHDTRVHVCLYFITPTGHGLKSLDILTMKMLKKKVNIIPVIAKSDTITKEELPKFKAQILSDMKANDISLYQFPTDDEAVSEKNAQMNELTPFAVVGSNDETKINGKMVRVRQYPWGCVEVDNEKHCDFVQLREMILHVNMEDLRERTHNVNYELFRRQRLTEMGFRDDGQLSLQETYEQRRKAQHLELKQREEEMRSMFVKRVQDKEQVLKDAEREVQAKFDERKKMFTDKKKKIEEQRRVLEEEMAAFERRKLGGGDHNQQSGGGGGKSSFTLNKKKK